MAFDIFLELGKKKTFAGAIDWPGWCRAGRDEDEALKALLAYAARYARALDGSGLAFTAPANREQLQIDERLVGNATTDFGAPGAVPEADAAPMCRSELNRCVAILKACWRAFDQAAEDAAGFKLRKGPRGGGRSLEKIFEHVIGAEVAYLRNLGWKIKLDPETYQAEELARTRQEVLHGLAASCRGELPAAGPRGGSRWPPRYFVRRVAWHVLDHVWEIEDRASPVS